MWMYCILVCIYMCVCVCVYIHTFSLYMCVRDWGKVTDLHVYHIVPDCCDWVKHGGNFILGRRALIEYTHTHIHTQTYTHRHTHTHIHTAEKTLAHFFLKKRNIPYQCCSNHSTLSGFCLSLSPPSSPSICCLFFSRSLAPPLPHPSLPLSLCLSLECGQYDCVCEQ